MKGIKYIILTLYLVAVIAGGIILTGTDHMVISKGFSHCVDEGDTKILVEQTKNSSVIYITDKDGKALSVKNLRNLDSHLKVIDVTSYDIPYAFVSNELGYKVVRFDADLSIVASSELFTLESDDTPRSIDIHENIAYITALGNNGMLANVYAVDLNTLTPRDEAENDGEQINIIDLETFYSVESSEGGFKSPYFDGKTVEDKSDEEVRAERENIRYYSSQMNLTFIQSFNVNSIIAMIFLAMAIVGAFLIVLMMNLVGKKSRFINQILIVSIFVLIGFAIMVVYTGEIIVPVLWTIVFMAIVVIVLYLEHRDLTIISADMVHILDENYEFKKPRSNSNEVQVLWRGLNELKYQFDKYKYISDSSTAAAMKFLPKNLGAMFGKTGLEDIKPGVGASVEGTMMILSSDGNLSNMMVAELEEYEIKSDGIMMVDSCGSGDVRMIFPMENNSIIKSGLNMMSHMDNDTVCTLYYYDDFAFSVVGTKTKLMSSVRAPRLAAMEELSKWFEKLNIRMAVSAEVKNLGDIRGATRYIGYIEDDGVKMDFYEVLDAYSEEIRARRIKCAKDFGEALSMYYRSDFYLARTAFSEILKVDSDDELSRWYLFMCEKYLNNADLMQKTYAFIPEK